LHELDIIIVNYNSTDYLLDCLGSIYKSLEGHSVKIFVADNASSDNIDRIVIEFPDVLLLKNKQNLGYAKAVNECLSLSSAPFVSIMNPDILINKGCFQSILSFMRIKNDIAIVGPKILDGNNSIQGSARAFPTPLTAIFGRSSILTKILPNNRISSKNILTGTAVDNRSLDVDWVSGAFMFVRRKAINQIGPMDDRFFMYWEDADWCKRMSKAGWRIVYYPLASVIHYAGCSSERSLMKSLFEFHKSAYYFYCKHHDFSETNQFLWKSLCLWGLSLRFYSVLGVKALARWCGRRI